MLFCSCGFYTLDHKCGVTYNKSFLPIQAFILAYCSTPLYPNFRRWGHTDTFTCTVYLYSYFWAICAKAHACSIRNKNRPITTIWIKIIQLTQKSQSISYDNCRGECNSSFLWTTVWRHTFMIKRACTFVQYKIHQLIKLFFFSSLTLNSFTFIFLYSCPTSHFQLQSVFLNSFIRLLLTINIIT